MAGGVRQNIVFYFALEEVVGRLNCVKWRNRFKTRHLARRVITHPDSTNLSLLVQFTKSGGCLLDGNLRIRPVHLIYINVVRLETAERILKLLQNTLARGVPLDSAGAPVDAYFGGEDDALSTTGLAHGFAHDFFRASLTVDRCGIEQIDAVIECRMNGTDGLLLLRSAPHPPADGPGAERNPRGEKICALDIDVFQHSVLSCSFF